MPKSGDVQVPYITYTHHTVYLKSPLNYLWYLIWLGIIQIVVILYYLGNKKKERSLYVFGTFAIKKFFWSTVKSMDM
jgi:hypothetical protein